MVFIGISWRFILGKIGGPPIADYRTMGKYVDHHLLGISWDIMRQNSKLLVETIKIIHI